jgi:proton-dependent oligopeptide transporter, POT family
MLLYTLGEMITNPQFSKYMSSIAPSNQKASYMGFMNLSLAIGLAVGSLIGGFLYKNYGEKSGLAIKYLKDNYDLSVGVEHSNSVSKLSELSGLNVNEVSNLLWNTYNPQYFWLVFLVIGLLSAFVLWIYSIKYKLK